MSIRSYKIYLFAMGLVAGAAFAQQAPFGPPPGPPTAETLWRETEDLQRTVQWRRHQLSTTQIERALSLVRQAQAELADSRRVNVCSLDTPEQMLATSAIIRDFAYGGDGLNLTSTEATAYVGEWMSKYPCAAAANFVAAGRALRRFAYNGNGLNMTSTEAGVFARTSLQKVCDSAKSDYPEEGAKLYDYAYSSNGLNLTTTGAAQYVRTQMEARYLSCDGDAFWRMQN
jgi:hypothetical protein